MTPHLAVLTVPLLVFGGFHLFIVFHQFGLSPPTESMCSAELENVLILLLDSVFFFSLHPVDPTVPQLSSWSMLFWMFLRLFSRNFSNLLRLPTIFDIHSILSVVVPVGMNFYNSSSFHLVMVLLIQDLGTSGSLFPPLRIGMFQNVPHHSVRRPCLSFCQRLSLLQFQIRCRTKHSMSPLPSMNLCLALLI